MENKTIPGGWVGGRVAGLIGNIAISAFTWVEVEVEAELGKNMNIQGFWAWDDGQPWIYSHWKDGEPNTEPGNNDDCLAIITWSNTGDNDEPGLWNDLDCDMEMSFICSKLK